MSDEMGGHFVADLGGDFVPVFAVLFGKDDLLKADAGSGENLFLDAANREDASAETDLAGHGGVGPDELAAKERCKGGNNGGTGAGAVFRGGAGGNVDVEVQLV